MERRHIRVNSNDSKLNDAAEEFQEEDVWMVFQETTENPGNHHSKTTNFQAISSTFPGKKNPGIIFQDESSLAIPKNVRHSAPVNIPDWSKIYGMKPSKVYDEDGGSEEDRAFTPPHEWIAGRNSSSFSVFEGAGRTLKGRDLSRVRNAVLIRTGFLELSKLDHNGWY